MKKIKYESNAWYQIYFKVNGISNVISAWIWNRRGTSFNHKLSQYMDTSRWQELIGQSPIQQRGLVLFLTWNFRDRVIISCTLFLFSLNFEDHFEDNLWYLDKIIILRKTYKSNKLKQNKINIVRIPPGACLQCHAIERRMLIHFISWNYSRNLFWKFYFYTFVS